MRDRHAAWRGLRWTLAASGVRRDPGKVQSGFPARITLKSSTGRNAESVRRSRVVLAPRPWRYVGGNYPAGNGGKKGRSPGRVRISRKAIARGKPGCLGCTCQTRVRFFSTHCTRRCGRSRRPAFPAPFAQRGPTICKPRAKTRRENAFCCLTSRIRKTTVVPGKRSAARDLHSRNWFAKAMAPACPTTAPCGYGSRSLARLDGISRAGSALLV